MSQMDSLAFCGCPDVQDKGQQNLPIIEGRWPGKDGGCAEQHGYKEMLSDARSGMSTMEIRRKHAFTYARFHAGADKAVMAHHHPKRQ